MRRVAITGMGAICALGHDATSTWAAMREGRSGIGPITNIPTELLNVKIAAEVRGFDPAAHFDSKKLPLLDRVSQFALVAAREAVAQSGLEFKASGLGERTACIVGTEVKDWQKLDFAGLKGRSEFDGKEIGAGPGTNVMGSALISLAWLANKLIEHGKHLRAGDVILTGSVHPPVFLPGPGTAKTEFVGLGGTETTYR